MMKAKTQGIVWIASYPKSGNTWVRCLISSLLAEGASPDLDDLGNICPNGVGRQWIENIVDIPTDDLTSQELALVRADAYRVLAAEGKQPRCIKVHDRYDPELFPIEASAGVVYIVRDPRDVAPSWACHMGVSLDNAISRMAKVDFCLGRSITNLNAQSPQILGSWSQHAESWLELETAPLLLLRYEDLLAEPVVQVARLAEFLGLGADRQLAARTADACRFDVLRQAEEAMGFIEKLEHMERFFRRGQSGVWSDALSATQQARILTDHGDTMSKLGYGPAGA